MYATDSDAMRTSERQKRWRCDANGTKGGVRALGRSLRFGDDDGGVRRRLGGLLFLRPLAIIVSGIVFL